MAGPILITHRRANPKTLRNELKSNLSPAEIEEHAIDMPAGSDHPRSWVGPPFAYDIVGAMQFQLLLELGIREHHRFLDVGCGSLRLGRFAIAYLLPGRYFGVEPNQGILRRGIEYHYGAKLEESQVIRRKFPTFSHNENFDFSFTKEPVDFAFAQSIASHTGPRMTSALLKGIADVTHERSIAMVTYIRCENPAKSNTIEGWFYPECVTYTDKAFGEFARKAGLHAYKSAWPSVNIRQDGLITTQQPCILTKTPWKPGIGQRLVAALFDGIVKIN